MACMDHHSEAVCASVFGRRKDAVFLERQGLLEPCGLTRFDTYRSGAYERHIPPGRTSLANRTRIKRLGRRTMGLSKTTTRHDLVIGLCVNRYECGRALYHEINTWETPSFLARM